MEARRVVAKVVGTKTRSVTRLVGSVDAVGHGTLHLLHSVDPIVLCDAVRLAPGAAAAAQPLYGVIACSIVLEGALSHRNNLDQSEQQRSRDDDAQRRQQRQSITRAGGVSVTAAGRGCVRDEVSLERSLIFQVFVRIFDSEMSLPPAALRASAAELPTTRDGAVLLVGEIMDGAETLRSPCTPASWPDACVLLRVQGSKRVALPEECFHGFFVVFSGAGTVAGEPVSSADDASVYVFGSGSTIDFRGDDLDVFVAAGQPLVEEPWVSKIAGQNGFGVFRNAKEAHHVMPHALHTGPDWSYKLLDEQR